MSYLKDGTLGEGDECLFCHKIQANDDLTHHVLFRGKRCFVTLNLYPYNNGHLMIVPYSHVSTLKDLDGATLTELAILTRKATQVLEAAYAPDGFNIGINIGTAAGAGVADHLHQHVVPRWDGDTNYMATIGQTRIIPEWIDETHQQLRRVWRDIFPEDILTE